MTRDEAINRLWYPNVLSGGYEGAKQLVNALVALELLKLDKPKSVEMTAYECIAVCTGSIGAGTVLANLDKAGLEIVRKKQ